MSSTRVVILLGRPGSGKGTQGQLLESRRGYVHLSTGELLRAAIRERSELGVKARKFVDCGQLVPDGVIVSLVAEHLSSLVGEVPGVVCDGFPRTVPQALALTEALNGLGSPAPVPIELRVSNERAAQRIEGREAGSGLITRSDDKPEIVQARMAVYEAETRPVIDYYESVGLLRIVDGSGAPEDVFRRICEFVD